MEFEFLLKVIVSLLLGALAGIEREHRSKGKTFAGFRSFMLVSFFGLLTGWLCEKFSPIFGPINIAVTGAIAVASRLIRPKRKFIGVTTELAFIISFLIGFWLYFDQYPYVTSIFLGFILAAILFAKETLHEIAYKASALEIRDTIIFVLIAFVIFPLLPDAYIGPLKAFNPRLMWKGLVIILGLSYFSYLLFRLLRSKGFGLNSFFSGLVNSMYVSYEYSTQFRKYPVIKYLLLVAISSMIFRAFLLGSIMNPSLMPMLAPLLITAFTGYAVGFLKARRKAMPEVRVKSPLSFRFAFFYALFFSSIVFIAHFISNSFGSNGIYVLAALIGLVDVSSLTITVSTISLPPLTVSRSILILTTVNIIGNWLMCFIFGKREFAREVLKVEALPLLLNVAILTSTFLF